MADNAVISNPGTGGYTFASDQIGGIEYLRTKLVWGADGAVNDTSAAAPMPVAVTGTAAATQSGTWTVQPGNTANTTAWLTTGTGGTFPSTQSGTWNITNISGTVSLPTGAATAAKQPALGTAGSPSTDVLTIQGATTGTSLPVVDKPTTSGGLSTNHLVSAATTNATVVKASAGQVYGWMITNRNQASSRKVAFHNAATTPTAGASVFFTVDLPPGGAANVSYEKGIAFSTGIAFTMVTGSADTDATAVAVGDLISNIFYA